jgi:hypothetical protein
MATKALRWTLSQDITAAIPPGDERLYEIALDIASGFRPLRQKEQEQLLAAPSTADPLFRA